MAQVDQKFFFGPSAQTGTAAVEVHTPIGQGVTNNPADFPFVDPSQVGCNSSGNPIKPVQVTVAGNVRFANPS
jgi:hypothetical protein